MRLDTTLENQRKALQRLSSRRLQKDALFSALELSDAIGNDDGIPTQSVATPFRGTQHKTQYLAQMNLGMPSDTALEN
jgi:hypothetical protein